MFEPSKLCLLGACPWAKLCCRSNLTFHFPHTFDIGSMELDGMDELFALNEELGETLPTQDFDDKVL